MTRTAADIRDYARTVTQLNERNLPDSDIDLHLRNAHQFVVQYTDWPFLRVSEQITAVSLGLNRYGHPIPESQRPRSITNVWQVDSEGREGNELEFIDYDLAIELYGWAEGTPSAWSYRPAPAQISGAAGVTQPMVLVWPHTKGKVIVEWIAEPQVWPSTDGTLPADAAQLPESLFEAVRVLTVVGVLEQKGDLDEAQVSKSDALLLLDRQRDSSFPSVKTSWAKGQNRSGLSDWYDDSNYIGPLFVGNNKTTGTGAEGRFQVALYQAAKSKPDTPTGGAYDVDNNTWTVLPTGWSNQPPTLKTAEKLWFSEATIIPAQGNKILYTEAGILGSEGTPGPPSPFQLAIWRAAAAKPNKPTGGEYDVDDHSWTTLPTGWSSGPPTLKTGEKLWFSDATINPAADPVTIAYSTVASVTGSVGGQGPQGVYEVAIYKRAATQPDKPTGGSVAADATVTPPTGWANSPPSGSDDLWESTAKIDPANATFPVTPTWSNVFSAGATGATGPRGAGWFTGSGDPAASVGLAGDHYLNEDTGELWTKTGSGWQDDKKALKGKNAPQWIVQTTPFTNDVGNDDDFGVLTDNIGTAAIWQKINGSWIRWTDATRVEANPSNVPSSATDLNTVRIGGDYFKAPTLDFTSGVLYPRLVEVLKAGTGLSQVLDERGHTYTLNIDKPLDEANFYEILKAVLLSDTTITLSKSSITNRVTVKVTKPVNNENIYEVNKSVLLVDSTLTSTDDNDANTTTFAVATPVTTENIYDLVKEMIEGPSTRVTITVDDDAHTVSITPLDDIIEKDWGDVAVGFAFRVGNVIGRGGGWYLCIKAHQKGAVGPDNDDTNWVALRAWRGAFNDAAWYHGGEMVLTTGGRVAVASSAVGPDDPDPGASGDTKWKLLALLSDTVPTQATVYPAAKPIIQGQNAATITHNDTDETITVNVPHDDGGFIASPTIIDDNAQAKLASPGHDGLWAAASPGAQGRAIVSGVPFTHDSGSHNFSDLLHVGSLPGALAQFMHIDGQDLLEWDRIPDGIEMALSLEWTDDLDGNVVTAKVQKSRNGGGSDQTTLLTWDLTIPNTASVAEPATIKSTIDLSGITFRVGDELGIFIDRKSGTATEPTIFGHLANTTLSITLAGQPIDPKTIDTYPVEARPLRDIRSVDTTDPSGIEYSADDYTFDNGTGNHYQPLWGTLDPTTAGDGWTIDNSAPRGHAAKGSDIVIAKPVKLDLQYDAHFSFNDRGNDPGNPDQITVECLLQPTGTHGGTTGFENTTRLGKAVFGDLTALDGDLGATVDVDNRTCTWTPPSNLENKVSFRDNLVITIGHGITAKAQGIEIVTSGARRFKLGIHGEFVSDPGKMAFLLTTLESNWTRGGSSHTVNKPAKSIWSGGTPTKGSPATFDVDLFDSQTQHPPVGLHSRWAMLFWGDQSAGPGQWNVEGLQNFYLDLTWWGDDDALRTNSIKIENRTFATGDRICFKTSNATNTSSPRNITAGSQKITLANSDDVAGRQTVFTGTIVDGKFVGTSSSDTSSIWWFLDDDGVVTLRKDVRKATFTVTVPEATHVAIGREAANLARIRTIAEGDAVTGALSITGTIRGGKAGDQFPVTCNTAVSGNVTVSCDAQTPANEPSVQTAYPGLLSHDKWSDAQIPKPGGNNRWSRIPIPAGATWGESRTLTFLLQGDRNGAGQLTFLMSLPATALQEITPLSTKRLTKTVQGADQYIAQNIFGWSDVFVAPLADGGIAIALADKNVNQRIKVFAE